MRPNDGLPRPPGWKMSYPKLQSNEPQAMSKQDSPRVLCVDDEPRVVEGLVLHLRKDYDVHTALSGDEALKKLKEVGGAAVVISDMRMPGMDGATLLHRVMSSYP